MKRTITIALLIFASLNIKAQSLKFPYYISDTLDFLNANGMPLNKSMSGGYNCPQFSPCDLNDDGKKDLVVYDKQDGSINTYINKGTTGQMKFELDNRYASYFPKMRPFAWMLMRDFNHDGYEDIFTMDAVEYVVYKNISYTVSGRPAFDRLPPIDYRNFRPTGSGLEYNRLSSPAMHLPGIYDIDFDGDLDIMSYSNVGGAITLWMNYQVEDGLPFDSMRFYMVDLCWGYYTDADCNTYILPDCESNANYRRYGKRHTNGSSITLFDADNDKDIDMLLGNEGCDHMVMLYNAKPFNMNQYDSFYMYDTNYVTQNNRAEVSIYPAAYFLDLDNDGNRDLIYAPNSTTYQYFIEDQNQIFWFKNIGTDSFPQWAQKQPFLTDEIIDVGKQSSWVFHDWDKDGDMDAIAANKGNAFYSADTADRIYLYENTGNAKSPVYKLKNSDFGSFRSLHIKDLTIAVSDLDNDGKTDLICGNDKGEILYYRNISGSNNTLFPDFKFANPDFLGINIDVGNYSAPAVADINKDGLDDLVIGRSDSMLSYYRNNGTLSQPSFTIVTNRFGGIKAFDSIAFQYIFDDTFAIIGYFPIYEKNTYSKPFITDLNGDDTLEIIVANSVGSLRIYEIDGNAPNSAFNLYDSFYYRGVFQSLKNYTNDIGNYLSVTAADLNSDSTPELIVANNRGGINYLKPAFRSKDQKVTLAEIKVENINGYPNPGDSHIEYKLNSSDIIEMSVFNSLGQTIIPNVVDNGNWLSLDISSFPSGFYVVTFRMADKIYTSKFQVIH